MGSTARTKGCRLCAVLAVLLLFSRIPFLSALSLTLINIECVYEYVLNDFDTVSGIFVVVDQDICRSSDYRGIDFNVIRPGHNVVLALKRTTGDRFEFLAPRRAMYEFCFKNPHETPEKVSFYIHVGRFSNEHDLDKDGFCEHTTLCSTLARRKSYLHRRLHRIDV